MKNISRMLALVAAVALVVVLVVLSVTQKSPVEEARNRLSGIKIDIDENALNEIKIGMKEGEWIAQELYEKYKDDPVKYKEESDKVFQQMLDNIANGK